ncbi:hypothetical protein EDB81DRAFT_87857 [Dactylonectria macrodidyma]|uniref:Calcium channel subunit cch1 n=1 Tax=Dactylonectria macrodidyma TaxID=307937 RepID=A0A9P9IWV7_9HYPO|nr:hypothetical protein EDB81DRAFT_87857 [Dactylonectria macrodidyma]
MFNNRFETVSGRFSPSRIGRSFRRSSRSSARDSYSSSTSVSSSASTINSIILRQPSLVSMEEERRKFGSELNVLEPRPIVYWGGVEERMGSLHF